MRSYPSCTRNKSNTAPSGKYRNARRACFQSSYASYHVPFDRNSSNRAAGAAPPGSSQLDRRRATDRETEHSPPTIDPLREWQEASHLSAADRHCTPAPHPPAATEHTGQTRSWTPGKEKRAPIRALTWISFLCSRFCSIVTRIRESQ